VRKLEQYAWLIPYSWLIPLGFMVGTFGTLIGAGGGFIMVPVLLLIYPHYKPETITSISLAVVFFNALSGSAAYARMKKIDYRSGWLFALATIPGAILGAWTVSYIPRQLFDLIFGILLLSVAIFLLLKPDPGKPGNNCDSDIQNKSSLPQMQANEGLATTANYDIVTTKISLRFSRHLVDADGIVYMFSYNRLLGVILSVFVGYFSSLLGIGGGIIHVPVLVHLLNFPVHIATATSHFVLAVMALSGSAVHVASGVLKQGLNQTIGLAIGAIGGAQLGAMLSKRFHGRWIIKSLAIALFLVGVRILILALF
jgi:uncharacterized membrane protein YfcA